MSKADERDTLNRPGTPSGGISSSPQRKNRPLLLLACSLVIAWLAFLLFLALRA